MFGQRYRLSDDKRCWVLPRLRRVDCIERDNKAEI